MAATAHAFLVSLMNTMDQIQNHPLLSPYFDNLQFEFLRKKVDFFLDFVENYADADSEEAEVLVRRIAASAHEAEDTIEVEAAERCRGRSSGKCPTLMLNLQRIIIDMNSIEAKVVKVKEETALLFIHSMPPPSVAAAPDATKNTKMVGSDRYMAQLLDELTGYHSGRRILPIVGMGGIGKTTLARNLYEHSIIVYRFDVRVWVTVSQSCSSTEILLQALSCLGGFTSTTDGDELGEKLRKTLYGRRYLIVLDDVWSVEAWEKIQFFFPDCNDGSRILVTTRQQEVVDYFASSALSMDLLDDKSSWELFCDKTFGQEGSPPELEWVGRKIVKKCKGLPLAISVIGGLLGRSPKVQEYWERIARDRSLILEDEGEGDKVLSILYLSYKNLPVWLKSTFLYLGLFPEDHQIDVSQLIQLLVAEGYIKANRKQNLEEVAESYINQLVDRNLLLVGDLSLNKELETCYLHDLVRELCISIAEKEDFYFVQRYIDGTSHYIVDQRTARYYGTESLLASYFPLYYKSSETASVTRPKIVHGLRAAPFKSRLLRVCIDHHGYYNTFHEFNLRYLCQTIKSYSLPIPWSLSLCWSLQTLKMSHQVTLPSEIWKMPQLRHIEIPLMVLPDPPPTDECDAIVLRNLQTLMRVWDLYLSEEVCKRIPDIKVLEIKDISEREDWNVGCLSKLERLWCSWDITVGLENLTLPKSLKELSLCGCLLPWSSVATIGLLPRLQILHLLEAAFLGAEWSLGKEEQFLSLKFLRIENCDDLICWDAEASNFPVLETLCLERLSKLEEIPSGIGDIPTLEYIYLYRCSESATISSMKILEEQQSLGNESLQLHLEETEYYNFSPRSFNIRLKQTGGGMSIL